MSVSVSIRITRGSYSMRKVRMQVPPAARRLPRRARGDQRARHEGRRRELHALRRPGTLEEERELAQRQLHAAPAARLPQEREAPLLDSADTPSRSTIAPQLAPPARFVPSVGRDRG